MASASKSNDYCPSGWPIRLVRAGLVGALLLGAQNLRGGDLSYGPLAHDFELTLEQGWRQEVAGPLFSWAR